MNYLNRPEKICRIAIPVVLLFGLLTNNKILDLQFHDTYYIISNFHSGLLSGSILVLIGLGYRMVSKMNGSLIKTLSGLHLFLTIGGILLLLFLTSITDTGPEPDNYETYQWRKTWIAGTFLVIIFSQSIYLLNLMMGLMRRNKQRAQH